MPARAMYKAELSLGDVVIPVKLYSAVEDRGVHFRLLHQEDGVPLQQRMTDPQSGEVVALDRALRGYATESGEYVVLTSQDQERLQPKPTRTMEVVRIIPAERLGHQWYVRPYYLGPDGTPDDYFALVEALASEAGNPGQSVEAIVRWVMRKKEYIGALRAHRGYLLLLTLRHTGEVIEAKQLPVPEGRDLDPKEQRMAAQLVEMLAGPFEPDAFKDEYRQRLEGFIAEKAAGGAIDVSHVPRREVKAAPSLAEVLEASVKQERSRKVA